MIRDLSRSHHGLLGGGNVVCHEKIDERFVVVIAAALLVLEVRRVGCCFGYSLCWVRRVDVAVQLP